MSQVHIVFQVLNFLFSSESTHLNLLPIDRLFLLALAKHKGEKGIYPSVPTLSRELKISDTYAKRIMSKLESLSLIKVDRRAGISNRYYLQLPGVNQSTTVDGLSTGNQSTTVTPTRQLQVQDPSTTVDAIKTNNQNREKKTERARLPSVARAPLSTIFEPDEDNVQLAKELRLNLGEELSTFRERKAKNLQTQLEFRQWLKYGYAYQARMTTKANNEPVQTAKFWGPGHPSWESLHGSRGQ